MRDFEDIFFEMRREIREQIRNINFITTNNLAIPDPAYLTDLNAIVNALNANITTLHGI